MDERDKQFTLEINEDELTEVVVSDEPVVDDDEDDVDMEGDEDEVIHEVEQEDIIVDDVSHYTFRAHTDSVYCVKVNDQ